MKLKEFIFLTIICLIFTLPFFQKGFFSTHDGGWAVIRLTEMNREIHDLQFPPRWSDYLNHGYGYPLFLFTYPLPYLLGETIHLLGFGFVSSIKILFVASVLLGSLGMYFFARKYWGRNGAIVSAVLYTIVPYRLVDLYIRGSLGESIAMAIVPWLFWLTERYIDRKKTIDGLGITVLVAFLILSHNTSAVIFFALLLLRVSVTIFREKDKAWRMILPLVKGLLISAFFWLPAFLEKKYVYLGNFPLSDINLHFANLYELLVHNNGIAVKPPLFIGYIHIIGFILSLIVILKISNRKKRGILLSYWFLTLLLVLFAFPFTVSLWKLPVLNSFDFPWRVLIGVAFLTSFLSGSMAVLPRGRVISVLLLGSGFFLYYPYVSAKDSFVRSDLYYETNDATTTSNDELMPIWVKTKPKDRFRTKVVTGEGEISDLQYSSKEISFVIDSFKDQNVVINSLYFPGWRYWLDNKEIEVDKTPEYGTVIFPVTSGIHEVKGKFGETPVRQVSDIISLSALLIFFFETGSFIKQSYFHEK